MPSFTFDYGDSSEFEKQNPGSVKNDAVQRHQQELADLLGIETTPADTPESLGKKIDKKVTEATDTRPSSGGRVRQRNKLQMQVAADIGSTDATKVRDFISLMRDLEKQQISSNVQYNDELRQALSAGGQGKNLGSLFAQVKKSEDYNKIKGFDTLAKGVHSVAPQFTGTQETSEENLFKVIRRGFKRDRAKRQPDRNDAYYREALMRQEEEDNYINSFKLDRAVLPFNPEDAIRSEDIYNQALGVGIDPRMASSDAEIPTDDDLLEQIGRMRRANRSPDRDPAADSGSGGSSPPLPPGTGGGGPSFPPGDGDGEEYGGGKDDPDKRVNKQLDSEFQRLKRRAQRQRKIEEMKAQREESLARQKIKARRMEANEQNDNLEGSTASDRIIRRLGSFGIARSLGQSGQIFAALSEMLVFQPEEMAADKAQTLARKNAAAEERASLAALDEQIFNRKIGEEQNKQSLEDKFANVRAKLDATKSPEEKAKILKTLGPQKGTLGGSPPVASSVSGSGGGAGIPPTSFGVAGAGPGGGSGGGGGFKLINDNLDKFGDGLQLTTKAILATSIAVEGLRVVSDGAVSAIQGVGKILSINPSGSPSAALGVAGNTANSASGLTGFAAGSIGGRMLGKALGGKLVGTAVGTMLTPVLGPAAPVLGSLLGGALGSSLAMAITKPIVAAITTGNQILESFTERSLGMTTIGVRAGEQVKTLMAKLRGDGRTDIITSEYSRSSGELSRAIIRMQTWFVGTFGDDITAAVRILAALLDATRVTMGGIAEHMDTVLSWMPGGVGQAWNAYQNIISLLSNSAQTNQEIANLTAEVNDAMKGGDPLKEIQDFFNTQDQFSPNGTNTFANSTLGFF